MGLTEKRPETEPGSTVLGLHFGHDAAVAVIRSGEVVAFTLCERFSRIKHQLGLDMDTIGATLKAAGLGPGDIDVVAVSSTQAIELLVDDPSRLVVRYCGEDEFDRPFATRFAGLSHEEIAGSGERTLIQMLSNPDLSQSHEAGFREDDSGKPAAGGLSLARSSLAGLLLVRRELANSGQPARALQLPAPFGGS